MVDRLARSYLTARMTKGVEFLHWFLDQGCRWGEYEYGIWRFYNDWPLPPVAAYSAVAHVVENVEQTIDIFPEGNIKAVVFRKLNEADAAIWLVKGEGRIAFNKIPRNLMITDVMGAPLAVDKTKDATTFAIGEAPIYLNLRASNIFDRICNYLNLSALSSFDRLCNAITTAELHVAPVLIQFVIPCIDKGVVILHNQTMHDLKTKIVCTIDDFAATNEVWIVRGKKAEARFVLPPGITGEEKKIKVEADCGPRFEKVTVSFPVGCMVCKRLPAPVTIDGKCSEWTGRPRIMMNNREQLMPKDQLKWEGTNDLSAVVWTGWDKTNFYFAAEVRDDFHVNEKSGNNIWNGDGFQMAFVPLVVDTGLFPGSGYGSNDTEIGLALAQGTPVEAQWQGPRNVWLTGRCTVKRDETTKMTRYEAAVPWLALGISPVPNKVFGFNFVLFDDDTGAGAKCWYQLSPGITNGKNPSLFKRFVLSE